MTTFSSPFLLLVASFVGGVGVAFLLAGFWLGRGSKGHYNSIAVLSGNLSETVSGHGKIVSASDRGRVSSGSAFKVVGDKYILLPQNKITDEMIDSLYSGR